MIGHNQPSFDDVVSENMTRGLLLSIKNTIIAAIDDPRLDRRHLRVLALVIERMNGNTGMAYPGRKTLAADSGTYGRHPYTEMTIATTIKELVAWGYLVYDRRGPVGGGRALSHYTIRKPSVEDLQAQITTWVRMQSQDRTLGEPWKRKADGEDGVHARPADGDYGVPVTDGDPVIPVSSDGDPVVSADGDPVVPTVTSIGTRRKTPPSAPGMFDEQPKSAQERDEDGVTGNPEFECFWESYPRKIGKASALKTFASIVAGKHKGIDKTSAGRLIRGSKGYAHHCEKERVDKQYIPHPQTWLNRAGWLDENSELPEERPRAWWESAEAVSSLKLEDWKRGIDKWCSSYWDSEHLGPPPGEQGCIVPEFVIHKLGLKEIFDHRGLRRA